MADTIQEREAGMVTTVVGKTYRSPVVTLNGIVTGAAYADLDALGSEAVAIPVPISGVIQSAVYIDRDDEGLQVDLWLFSEKPANQTDNAAFVVSDAELQNAIGRIQFTSFGDANTGQIADKHGLGMAYVAPQKVIYAQAQARGAVNIAAGNEPRFKLTILADE